MFTNSIDRLVKVLIFGQKILKFKSRLKAQFVLMDEVDSPFGGARIY